MLSKLENNSLFLICNFCGVQSIEEVNISQSTDEVYSTIPCLCGAREFFNLNIELEEESYDEIIDLNMHNKEINQRKYVRDLINIINAMG